MQQASASVSLLARRCVFYITSQRDPLGDNKPTLTGQQPLELLWGPLLLPVRLRLSLFLSRAERAESLVCSFVGDSMRSSKD